MGFSNPLPPLTDFVARHESSNTPATFSQSKGPQTTLPTKPSKKKPPGIKPKGCIFKLLVEADPSKIEDVKKL